MDWLNAFLESPAGMALMGALVAAFADFAVGVYAALRDGTFALDALAAFVRKHLMGRVFPLGTLLVLGYISGNVALNAAAIAGLTAYAAETLASVYASIKVPDTTANAVPED